MSDGLRISRTEVLDAVSDVQLVGLTMLGEARGAGVQGMVDVGCVVRNRLQLPGRFGRSYRTVCLARGQFSCWWAWGGQDNYRWMLEQARWLTTHGQPSPLVREGLFLAEGIVSGALQDAVRGSTHYYAPAAMVPRNRVPDWAEGRRVVAERHGHKFYRVA